MTSDNKKRASGKKTALWYTYLASTIFLAFTGFGQMPIYKRYYISDIPGLGWSANFYTTHLLHYIFSALFLGITAYVLLDYLLIKRKTVAISLSGYIRGGVIAGLIFTGLLLVIFNLSGVFFPIWATITLLLAHMGLAMAFIAASLVTLLGRKPWTVSR